MQSRFRIRPARILLLAALACAVAALVVVTAGASGTTAQFSGQVDASSHPSDYHSIVVTSSGTLRASLTWPASNASMALVLGRRDADGTWQWVTSVRGSAPPLRLTYPVTPGTWRVGSKALAGAADYSMAVEYPGQSQDKTYVTLLFSRTAITAADSCVANSTGVTPLLTGVAPELARRGLVGTGSVQVGITGQHARQCTHYHSTLVASWDDLAYLRDTYGWAFVSHSRTYPDWPNLTIEQQREESCGTLPDFIAHGHTRADGMFAYPHNHSTFESQNDVVSTCFAFGRRYGTGVNTRAAVTTPPYFATAWQVGGGNCNRTGLVCATVSNLPYRSPVGIANAMAGLQPGHWMILQSYLLVTGYRAGHWDCRSADWRDHWTNDWERYCWNDYLRILDAIPFGAITTDPKTVAQAWGRTDYGSASSVSAYR